MKTYTSLAEAAQAVLDMQDACNSRGLIHAFPAVVNAITQFDPQQSTDAYNKHPLIVLVLDKLVSLTETWVNGDNFSMAYDATKLMAARK